MTAESGNSYVSWGAIMAGAVLASALSVVMVQFGAAIGLTATDIAEGDQVVSAGRVFSILFWVLWVQVLASMIGGYIAGRLRTPAIGATPHEAEVRDGAHGLMVWATSTLAVFVAGAAVAAFAALVPPEAVPAATAAIDPVQTQALAANHKEVAVVAAFSMAAISLVSGVGAWFAATKGGDHRDNNTDLTYFFSFRR